jgi:hypothetical protein
VKLSGVPAVPDVRAMLQEVLRQRNELKGALLEVKVAIGLDFVAIRQLFDESQALGFPPDFKFAVLLLDEQARRSADFAQDVAQRRGVGVRVFSAREEALRWLQA